MAIVISGVNNNDKITASDGTIDLLSGVNYTGILTAPAFSATGNITAASINVGNNIQLGNAGVATATTFVGNLTGNVNSSSVNLLFQIGGSEKLRLNTNGEIGILGANYGTSGQVLTSQGAGSAVTWSTITGTTINNNANDRVITGSASANTLEGEANLTFNGNSLLVNNTSSNTAAHFKGAGGAGFIQITDSADSSTAFIGVDGGTLKFQTSGSSYSDKLTIDSSGKVSVNGLMEASRTRNTPITTTERNALGTPDEGTMIYNSTLKKLQVYTDNQWVSFSGKIITTGGGTVSNDSDRSGYVVHTFTSPGTFSTDAELEGVEVMVVGGGGGGGGNRYGSGGGAGGVIMRPASPAYPLSSPAPVVIGSGGAGGVDGGTAGSGSNSTFGTGPMTLIGKGGGGGTSYDGPVYPGRPGGSGAGGTSRPPSSGGSATQPGTHGAGTDYGNRGGNYANGLGGGWAPAGGGGAGGQGVDTPTQVPGGGNGGVGVQLSVSGSATYYAGGGASGIYNNLTGPGNHQGIGGNGGGGSSSNSVPGSPGHSAPGDGATNSGGGGCGAHGQNYGPGQNATSTGKSGGSGIVIVAYPLTQSGGDIVVS